MNSEQFKTQIALLRKELFVQKALLAERDKTIETLKSKIQELEQENGLDCKLKIPNNEAFMLSLAEELKRAQRETCPVAVLMIDVDCFKQYNDRYGHIEGDACLKQLTKIIDSILKRPGDLLARFGGDEFSVKLPNTDFDGALKVAEDIERIIYKEYIQHSDSEYCGCVTVTIGVASKVPTADTTAEDLMREADEDLYQKKRKKNGQKRMLA